MTPRPCLSIRTFAGALLVIAAGSARAGNADLSNQPLATQGTSSVRANLMFVLDDSGSMGYDYLPDSANYANLCFGHSGTNSIFYNPASVYLAPLQASGTPFPDASFTAAYDDGYKQSGGTTNLSVVGNLTTPSTQVQSSNPKNAHFYYATYTATNPAVPACGSGYDWTKWSVVTSSSGWTAAQKTNYANWYSFYRTRMLAMRASVGRAINGIDAARFRVGYSAISSNSYTSSTGFLPIKDFDSGTQKSDFYAKLYAAPTNGYTPLRPGLEKIGKYFGNRKLDGSALGSGQDPLQYSCQRNYAIMTTDGYWNLTDEPNLRSNYAPTQLDGSSAIGNQDGGSTPRPLLDDGKTQGSNWVTGGSGVANSLADIAMYFYQTDLRTGTPGVGGCVGAIAGQDVCANDVKPSGNDTAGHQHMTTFAVGLGVAGQLAFRPDYETATSGDFYKLKQGTIPWPNPNVTSTGATVVTRADDLWHAAVNGHGRYYSAASPADLVTGLSNALDSISSTTGSGAAAATSSQQPVAGDNAVFLAQYTTVLWQGNLKALTIDTATGAVSTTASWEAKDTLKAQVAASTDTRNIYFFNGSGSGTQLSSFTYANLSAAGKGAPFVNLCQTGAYKLSQCAALVAQGAAMQTSANDGGNVVNYLRGRTEYEDIVANAGTARLFRPRVDTPLGDVINAAPVYVKASSFRYTDAGYSSFKASTASRVGVVYLAANDGMLHAFSASTGAELWAFVPSMVMANLWRLADADYANGHRYFVDGTPVVGDVYDGTNWRTVLVGGLNAGGRGYYALDVTDPANPKALWELSSANEADLGLSYGNPVITKNKAGAWVVAFTSGYNNVSPGDGNGHLYVRNAITGASLANLPTYTSGTTAAGSTATPSNLAKISAWVDADTDNTAKRLYGGDMLGNLWRFDADDNVLPAGNEALRLGQALTPGGAAQPVTVRPQLTKVAVGTGTVPTVAFATGRYLGATDVGDSTLQSVYVLKDDLTATGLGVLRDNAAMVQQTMASTVIAGVTTRRVTTLNALDWNQKSGWYMDFSLSAGERVNVDMQQSARLLAVATNTPAASACNPGGTSELYFFDITNGSISDAFDSGFMTAGLNLVKIGTALKVIQWDVTSKATVRPPNSALFTSSASLRRSSWRELAN
ncbi:MAG TPA: PilC/PilY family type IV pilus protein [Burkholderiaceae bacterium]|nr:PilC/PilY family type IV pilus protein [Burkholderiaceae bacterium]